MDLVFDLPGGRDPEHSHPHREDGGCPCEGDLGRGRWHGARSVGLGGVQVSRRRRG